jgi:SAM-dependent methyltransferase
VDYVGRPGISPALAALIALGKVRRRDHILDVGCGTGTDALLLARWGFRHVVGVDPDGPAIGAARSRAARARLGRRVRFHAIGAERLSETFAKGSFDVVLHTLVANNLKGDKGEHFRELAAVLKPDGLLVLHERVMRRHETGRPGKFPPLAALKRYFDVGAGLATHLAEHDAGRRGPSYARVILWIGRRR